MARVAEFMLRLLMATIVALLAGCTTTVPVAPEPGPTGEVGVTGAAPHRYAIGPIADAQLKAEGYKMLFDQLAYIGGNHVGFDAVLSHENMILAGITVAWDPTCTMWIDQANADKYREYFAQHYG